VVGSYFGPGLPSAPGTAPTEAGMATLPTAIFDDIVDRHTDRLPTEIQTDAPEQADTWLQDKLAFRARSVQFAEPRVRFMGARVSNVGSSQAARLYYNVGNSRLTLIVFRPPPSLRRAMQPDSDISGWGGQRARVGQRVVTYRTVRGYTVPIIQHDDVAYAFTGDLDREQLLRLVAAARLP
jgi:hypothetical protein